MDKAMYITNKDGAVLTKLRERDGVSECFIENKQGGESTLSFTMLTSSEKYEFLQNAENLVIADGKVYTQLYDGDSFNEKKDTGNKNSAQISLVERQYLLGKAYITAYNSTTTYDHIDNTMVVILSGGIAPLIVNGEEIVNPYEKGSAAYALYALLYDSGWTVGTVDVDGKFDLESDKKSILENIKAVQSLWGGILIFDSLQKIVHLRSEEIYQPYNGYGIRFRFNETGLERNISKNIVTRLFVYGKDGLNIAASNDGKEYLEDYSYTSTPLYGLIENNDISNVGDLIVWGERELKKLSTPQVTLKISLIDRPLLENSGVSFDVSDMVDVADEDLSENRYRARVTEKKYEFFRPWNCSSVTLGDEKEVFAAKIKYALTSADKVNNLVDLMGKLSSDDVIMNSEDGTRQTMTSYVQLTNQALEAGFKVIGVDGYERTGKTSISIDGIDVYNGGIVVRDRQNDIKIYMDGETGNIVFSGDLYGASGTFKGALQAATGTFSGELKAATGEFEGKITAKSGYIGSWEILEGGIVNVNNALALTANGEIVAANGKFSVNSDGALYAEGVNINGAFSASTENSNVVFSKNEMLIYFASKDDAGNIKTCCKISPTEFYFYSYNGGTIESGICYRNGNLELIKPVDENGDKYTTSSEVSAEIEKKITETTASIKLYVKGQGYMTYEEADKKYLKQVDLYAGIESYVNTEEGTAGIISACQGTYITKDEAGDFVHEVDVKNIISQEISESGGSIKQYIEGKNYLTQTDGENLFVSKTKLYAGIESYVNTEEGTASITSACSGTYLTKDEAKGFVSENQVKNIISQEMSETTGSIKLFVEGKSYITQQDAEKTYTKQTDLYSGIENYINTEEGTSSIISACRGTFQSTSDMDEYSKTTEVEASISQAVSDKEADIKLFVSKTYQTIANMGNYSTTTQTQSLIDLSLQGITLSTSTKEFDNQTESTLTLKKGSVTIDTTSITGTTAKQAASIAADAVNGITLSVTNGKSSSTLAIKSGSTTLSSQEIKFTGTVTFDDLKTKGSTVISGDNITTGKISADYIDVTNIYISKLGNARKKAMIDCSDNDTIYIGGSSSDASVSTVYLRTNGKIAFGRWSYDEEFWVDVTNKTFYAEPNVAFLGKSGYRWSAYLEELHIGKSNSDAVIGTDSSSGYEFRPYSTSSTCYLGTSSLPWHYGYIKNLTVTGSIDLNYGTSNLVKGTASTSQFTLRPSSASDYSACYLGTSSYPWHYGYFKNLYVTAGNINLGNSSAKIGFFGTTPTAKKSVSGSTTDAKLTSLITALKNYGLIS